MKADGRLISAEKLWTKSFVLITTVNFLLYFGFQMLMPTLPIYVKNMGADDAVIGWINGIFTISALIIRPLTGAALDRYGRRVIILSGLIIFIGATAVYSILPTVALFLAMRFIHGLGWGIASTASNTVASDFIPQQRFGEGMGYFSLTSNVAAAAAPALGLCVLAAQGFRSATAFSGGLVVLSFMLSLILTYRQSNQTSPSKKKIIPYEKTSIRPAIVVFFVTVTYGAVHSFIPLYALEKGIENIGAFFTVMAISMLLSRPVIGRLIDRFNASYAVLPGLLSLIIALYLLAAMSALPLFLISAFFFGIGFGATQTSLQTLAVRYAPRDQLGAANSIYFTGFDSGIGVGSIILGMVAASSGYSNMFRWSILAIVAATILYLLFSKEFA